MSFCFHKKSVFPGEWLKDFSSKVNAAERGSEQNGFPIIPKES
jgi:hypothetical protein